MRNLRERMKNKKGFTLVELIIVIAILGIIAVIAIPNILGAVDNSRKKSDVTNAKSIANAVVMARANSDTLAGVDLKTIELKDMTVATGITEEDLINEVIKQLNGAVLKPKFNTTDNTAFFIKADAKGVSVYVGKSGAEATAVTTKLYPAPEAPVGTATPTNGQEYFN